MTQERIKIGNPPDFRMTAGKQLYHHQASIKIELGTDNSYTLSLSNGSMLELVKTLKEKLLVIGLTTQTKAETLEDDYFTSTLFSKTGVATIKYRRLLILSRGQWQFLKDAFTDELT